MTPTPDDQPILQSRFASLCLASRLHAAHCPGTTQSKRSSMIIGQIVGRRYHAGSRSTQRICEAVSGWQDVTVEPHRFGGVEFRLDRRELGHVHGDWLVDIPFPKQVRDEVISAGDAEPHHVLPDTGWVSVFLRTDEDVERAVRLLQRSFFRAVAHKVRLAEPAKQKGP